MATFLYLSGFNHKHNIVMCWNMFEVAFLLVFRYLGNATLTLRGPHLTPAEDNGKTPIEFNGLWIRSIALKNLLCPFIGLSWLLSLLTWNFSYPFVSKSLLKKPSQQSCTWLVITVVLFCFKEQCRFCGQFLLMPLQVALSIPSYILCCAIQ